MRTRNKKMKDYGISDAEAMRTIAYCRNHTTSEELSKIQVAAIESNPAIWRELLISVCSGQSYQYMIRAGKDIPYSEIDFYGYRRKMIAILSANLKCKDK